jgi:hypothetical protein
MNNSCQSNNFYTLLKEKNSIQILNEMEKYLYNKLDLLM